MVIGLKVADAPGPHWEFPLDVLYEDDELAVVFKPSGVTTGSAKRRCLKNALPFNLRISTERGALLAPLPVHRLDHATEGLVLCAKTAFALADLGQQFEAGTIEKLYVAHVHGWYTGGKQLDTPIGDKVAITNVVSVEHRTHKSGAQSSVLVLKPLHGRTHQLRIHLSRAGHSIIGDALYGSTSKGKLRLKATSIQFIHPKHRNTLTVAIQ
jgi:tRNA pseudouridine65 synthase/23S rRNA pseudouridine1911/1915/1917 synthase